MTLSVIKVSGLLVGGLLSVIGHSSFSAVTVTLTSVRQTVAVPLTPPVISAGVDVPVGTVLYQASLIMKDGRIGAKWPATDVGKNLYCIATAFLINTPLPLAEMASGPYADGVYQTGIPGIGVAILLYPDSTHPLTKTKAIGENRYLLDSSLTLDIFDQGAISPRSVALIKTGPLTPGSYSINGANFPTGREGFENSQSSHANAAETIGFPIFYWDYSFQGNITVSAQTCTTPDVSVNLGTYEIGEHFRSLNSTTAWKDASITLTNCPKFFGFYNSTNEPLLMNYNTGASTSTTSINNSIGVRLTPNTDVINAANGVMAIDSRVSGAASGVGIQLGWGESSQTPSPFNFSAEKSVILSKDGTTNIRIPLAARYIQTAASPTPGKADGKVTFTINYY